MPEHKDPLNKLSRKGEEFFHLTYSIPISKGNVRQKIEYKIGYTKYVQYLKKCNAIFYHRHEH